MTQRNKNNRLKARDFKGIWRSLNTNQRRELRSAIMSKTGCTCQSIYNWGAGRNAPRQELIIREVVKAISGCLDREVSASELFPDKPDKEVCHD